MKGINYWILIWTLLLCTCQPSGKTFEVDDLHVEWSVVSNDGGVYQCSWSLTNNGDAALDTDWALYYNQVAGVPVAESLPENVIITQETGTFYSIKPDSGFYLGPGEKYNFNYKCYGAAIKITDAPSGLYMILAGEEPQMIEEYSVGDFSMPQQINRSADDRVPIPTPQKRFDLNQKLSLVDKNQLLKIIPTPQSMQVREGSYRLPVKLTIAYQTGLESIARQLADHLATGEHPVELMENDPEASIQLSVSNFNQTGDEAYRLTIDDNGIDISGSSMKGVFYGTQSLLALLPLSFWNSAENTEMPFVEIEDEPGFAYRGMHLDVARNFHPPESIKKMMDIMAFYKLNKFHFHLTDDEGWRLAIDGLPELTDVGATRGHTETEEDRLTPAYGSGPHVDASENYGTGYYTREEFIDILRFAHARQIEVIPELNFPGHARAAIKAMQARDNRLKGSENSVEISYLLHDPEDQSEYKSVQGYTDNVICICRESVYQFLEKVVSEVVSIYQEAEVPLNVIHTGGDEVPAGIWEKSPICDQLLADNPDLEGYSDLPKYFLQRYHDILNQHDLVTGGWEEIAMHKVAVEEKGDDPLSAREVMVPNPEFKDNNFLVYVWLSIWGVAGEDLAYKLANMGYPVVMSNASNLYFDFAYDKDPLEPGFYWAGLVDTKKPFELVPLDILKSADLDIMGNPLSMDRYEQNVSLTDEGRRNIKGIQGQLWTETVKGPEMLEYYLLPKLIGLSERAWSPNPQWANNTRKSERMQELDRAWNLFANTIAQKELPRLDLIWGSVNYRLPPPGAVLDGNRLNANVGLPGLDIHYTLDGAEPTMESPKFEKPVRIESADTVKLKSFTSTGHMSRTTHIIYPE